MSIKSRLQKLEKKSPQELKVFVIAFDESGRVRSGNSELIGKTRAEVGATIGADAHLIIIRKASEVIA